MATSESKNSPVRFVVTGGPSVGKADLFGELRKQGLASTEGEPAREIYRAFKERLGRHLQVGDRREYSSEVLRSFISEFSNHKTGVRFYNRGIPDGIGWDRFFGLSPSSELMDAARAYRYDAVFVLDPLHHEQDEQDVVWAKDREIRRVHELIIQGYYDAGYEPVFVPADSPEVRVRFILANVPPTEG